VATTLRPFGTKNLRPFGTKTLRPFGTKNLRPFGTKNLRPFGTKKERLAVDAGSSRRGVLPVLTPSADSRASLTPDLPRKVGFWGAVAVMVGVVIGSGIFKTPTTIANNLGDPWLILALWFVAGLIALCGALTFAELAARMPRSGGIYVFIREGFGPCPAFVFGWTYMLITKPSAAAGIAIIFAEHFNTVTGLEWSPQWLTCGALFFLTLINVLGVRGSARFAVVLTGVKYAAILGIIGLGVFAALREMMGSGAVGGAGVGGFVAVPSPRTFFQAIVPVMAAIMWTYDGWSDVGAIAGEVKDPRRTLPRVYIFGTLSVIGLYVLANAVYMWFIPLPEMAATKTVAPLLLERLVGPVGGTVAALVIIVSTLGSSHASVMTGARVTFAQARDGLLFRFLARIHPRYETPAVALWVQFGLSCLAVLVLQDFANLAGSFVFTMWIFYGMGAVALFVLRRRERSGLLGVPMCQCGYDLRGLQGSEMCPECGAAIDWDRRASVEEDSRATFRVPGFPVVPALFIATSVVMTVLSILDDPKMTLAWLGVLFAGVPVYFLWRRLFPGSGVGRLEV
jgi:APA family basic amino acid/polyamine antiporter